MRARQYKVQQYNDARFSSITCCTSSITHSDTLSLTLTVNESWQFCLLWTKRSRVNSAQNQLGPNQVGPKPSRPKTNSAQNQLGPKLTRPCPGLRDPSTLFFFSRSLFFFFFFLFLLLSSFVLWLPWEFISLKGVLHPWALFLKTLCIFSKNKATSYKVSHGSGQKRSKELKNHSFTFVETTVMKLHWKMCENQYFSCFEP